MCLRLINLFDIAETYPAEYAVLSSVLSQLPSLGELYDAAAAPWQMGRAVDAAVLAIENILQHVVTQWGVGLVFATLERRCLARLF